MGLFGKKKPNYDKLLDSALVDYENGEYAECYRKVCEAADGGSGRGLFCKAFLQCNDRVCPSEEMDLDSLQALMKASAEQEYPLGCGFYATVLEEREENEALCAFLKKPTKIKDGIYQLRKSFYYFGHYSEDGESQADENTTLASMREALRLLDIALKESQNKKSVAFYEYRAYNPFPALSFERIYAKACFLLMTGLYCYGERADRRTFMDTYQLGLTYMPVNSELLRMIRLYAWAVFKNSLGMRDINEAHKTMRTFVDVYNRLDEETQELYREDYDELMDDYENFCDEENERLANREICYSDGNADMNFLTAKNVASALSDWAQRTPSSSESSTTTYYPIGNTRYTRSDDGYLYDEQGFRSDYRVDDVGRLYDENGTELGYYNYKGLFISSK